MALSKEQRFLTQFGRGEFHTVKYYGTTYDPEYGNGLVMEYVGGGDLRSWLLQYNPSKSSMVIFWNISDSNKLVFLIPQIF